jgi:hypothetical protein
MINGEVFREKNNPWMSRFWKERLFEKNPTIA